MSFCSVGSIYFIVHIFLTSKDNLVSHEGLSCENVLRNISYRGHNMRKVVKRLVTYSYALQSKIELFQQVVLHFSKVY